MSELSDNAGPPRSSRWIPWAFVGFFVVIFAVNGVMLTFALKSFNGLWTDGAYDRGLGYNQTIAERQAQIGLGWQVAMTTAETGAQRSVVTLSAFDGKEHPLPGVVIEGIARRPASEQGDFALTFHQTGRGLYEAIADWPLPGLWEIRLTINSGGQDYRLDKRLIVH